MMAGHPQVKVATFQPCDCSFSNETHLLVGYKIVDLVYGNAVAISYTWGEFDCRKVILGHDGHGSVVEVCLGQEWCIEDVVQALARIRREHARSRGCWMDQLCLPQMNPVERRDIVMQISDIYRTFRTVVMLCGNTCRCFNALGALSLVRERTNVKLIDTILDAVFRTLQQNCWDPFRVSSYFQRLWTRQEFRYSIEISVVWSSNGTRDCVRSVSDWKSLSPYSQKILQRINSFENPVE